MADAKLYSKHQIQEHNQANTSKFYTHFMYKALIVAMFLVVIPLFPSQAPEFINQTLLNRSWELLHLIFVGIAVSYGLFSRRNEETEKENNPSKFDNAQSYVSRFLQVSSVFDDEPENLSGSEENSKVQTWSNQYYRNEPMVVVAKENSVLEEQRGISSRISEKPLLLPVRSLKSRVLGMNSEENRESSANSGSLSRSNSNSGSKRYSSNSNKAKNGESGGLDHVNFAEKLNESVVLPSPIPWRSRSGRMEVKEDVDSPPLYTLSPSMEESEFHRGFRSQTSRSSRPNSANSSPKLSPSPSLSSPKKLSPSPSLSAESQAKSADDLVRKKSFYRSSVPPPPPLPPPMIRRSSSMKPSPSLRDDEVAFKKDFQRSFTSERKELNSSEGENQVRPKACVDDYTMGKSVRTTRSSNSLNGVWIDKGIDDVLNGELEVNSTEKMGRKMVRFNQSSFRTEGIKHKSIAFMPKQTFMEYEDERNEESGENVMVETENEDSESDDDVIVGSSFAGNVGGKSSVSGIGRNSGNEEAAANTASDGGPDVDKKADEFIAKFREQIRLQRIDSIKRSTAHISRNSSRQS